MSKLVVYIKNLNSISIFLLFYIFQLFLGCFQCTSNFKKKVYAFCPSNSIRNKILYYETSKTYIIAKNIGNKLSIYQQGINYGTST